MANVYLVTEGAYSDYKILAVFSSSEKAAEYIREAEKSDYGGVRVEVYELDNDNGERFHLIYFVSINLATGDVVPNISFYTYQGESWRLESQGYRGEADVQCHYGSQPHVQGESAVSREHALKLAAECRQKWLREVQPLPKTSNELGRIWKARTQLVVKEKAK